MPHHFQVATKGIFIQEHRVLLLEFESQSYGKAWDLPGGRIDEQEDLQTAFTREISEELVGVTNPVLEKILHVERAPKLFPDGSGLIWLFFKATGKIPENVTVKDEHTGLRWASDDDLTKLAADGSRTFPPGFLRALRQALAE